MIDTVMPMTTEDIRAALGLGPATDGGGREIRRVVCDHREVEAGDVFVGLVGRRFDGAVWVQEALDRGAVLAVASEAAPEHADVLRVPDPVRALARIASLARERFDGTVVAITGSMGKTSVKEHLAALSGAVGETVAPVRSFNNLEGVSRTLLTLQPDTERLVLEMGTNAPGEIAELAALGRPTHAVLTAIGPAHLEGLGSIAGIVTEKTSLAEAVGAAGKVFFNADDEQLASWAAGRADDFRLVPISLDPTRDGARTPARVEVGAIHERGEEAPIRHGLTTTVQVRNLWIAWVVAAELGGSREARLAAIADAAPAPLRGERRAVQAATVILDCYNASPLAMEAALDDLAFTSGRKVAFLGDMLELGDESASWHARVARHAAAHGLDAIHFLGAEGAPFHDHAGAVWHATIEEARAAFRAEASLGGAILLKASRGLALERLLEDDDV